jgi:hypothetical protein
VNAPFSRQICAQEIASASIHSMTEWATVLCAECAREPFSRAVIFPHCPAVAHTVGDHPVVVGTRFGAHPVLMRIRRIREVAGG